MRTRSDNLGAAPLAWPRAIAFGIVAGGMGVLGHDLVAGTPTQPWVLVAGAVFAMLVARPLAPLRIGTKTMLVGVAVLQTVVHLACIAMFDAGPVAEGAAHAHAHMAMPGGDLASGGWPMLFAHAVSLLLGAAVLLTLEQHAWAGVRAVARQVVEVFVGAFAVPRPGRATGDLRFPVRAALPRVAACRDVARALGMRGPPVGAVASH